jgi:hypothetical protein
VHQVPQRSRSSAGAPSVARHGAGEATRAGGRGGASGVDHRAIAHRAIAQGYLDKPVTKALEALMRKGVKAFLAVQVGKRPPPPDPRVYYACQACSICRADPAKATYVSFSAKAYPEHPLHCAGFAAYDVPLPERARAELQRHVQKMRRNRDAIVAVPPASVLGRWTNNKR